MPRAGNTIIGSIINTNKSIKMTSYSILPQVINDLILLKQSNTFKNYPDHKSIDNIIKNIFENYYNDWDYKYIIERGWWGTDINLRYLNTVFKKPKFIILWRPVLECLASFVKINRNNFLKNDKDVISYVANLMHPKGGIGLPLNSIKNLIKSNQNYKIFYYHDFIKDKKKFIKSLSYFIGTGINFPKKISQFELNGLKYDDKSINQEGLHIINTNLDYIPDENYEKYLPKEIIQKYKGADYEFIT